MQELEDLHIVTEMEPTIGNNTSGLKSDSKISSCSKSDWKLDKDTKIKVMVERLDDKSGGKLGPGHGIKYQSPDDLGRNTETIMRSPTEVKVKPPSEIEGQVETPSLQIFLKSKGVLFEAVKTFVECKQNCEICYDFLMKFNQHLASHRSKGISSGDCTDTIKSEPIDPNPSFDNNPIISSSCSNPPMNLEFNQDIENAFDISPDIRALIETPKPELDEIKVNTEKKKLSEISNSSPPPNFQKLVVETADTIQLDLMDRVLEVERQELLVEDPLSMPESDKDTSIKTTRRTRYSCNQCDLNFNSFNTLVIHKRTHFQGNRKKKLKSSSSRAPPPQDSLVNPEFLNNTKSSTTQVEKLHCNHCNKSFFTSSSIRHHAESQYCQTCDETFPTFCLWNNHLLSHHKSLKCDDCEKVFKSRKTLKAHKVMMHSQGARRCVCSICGVCFVYKSQLAKHYLTHKSNKPLCCKQCNKRFAWKYNLELHEKRHLVNRPFRCLECDKSFVLSGLLKVHQRTHARKKIYQCLQCWKGFITKWGISNHDCSDKYSNSNTITSTTNQVVAQELLENTQVHLPVMRLEGPVAAAEIIEQKQPTSFPCNLCGKEFSTKQGLSKHLLGTHGKKKVCHHCGDTFSLSGNLNRHLMTYHPGMSHTTGARNLQGEECECPKCGAICSKRHLRRHLQKIHNVHEYPAVKDPIPTNPSVILEIKSEIQPRYYPESNFQDLSTSQSLQVSRLLSAHPVTASQLGEKPLYQCEICSKTLKSRAGLTTHMRVHVRRPFVDNLECPTCKQTFATRKSMMAHMKNFHEFNGAETSEPSSSQIKRSKSKSVPYGKYKCENCNQYFKTESALNSHIKIHLGLRNDLTFDNLPNVQTTDTPYKCKDCGKLFRAQGNLNIHQKKTMEKIHICKYEGCREAFRNKCQLESHYESHLAPVTDLVEMDGLENADAEDGGTCELGMETSEIYMSTNNEEFVDQHFFKVEHDPLYIPEEGQEQSKTVTFYSS